MAQVLSQDEVDALLNAVNDGDGDDLLGGDLGAGLGHHDRISQLDQHREAQQHPHARKPEGNREHAEEAQQRERRHQHDCLPFHPALRFAEVMAERVGFEPTRRANAWRFSRPLPSTARPPLRNEK